MVNKFLFVFKKFYNVINWHANYLFNIIYRQLVLFIIFLAIWGRNTAAIGSIGPGSACLCNIQLMFSVCVEADYSL